MVRGRHLLGIEGMSEAEISVLFDRAEAFYDLEEAHSLAGRLVVNFFSEPSTRTRLTFEIAAKRLGAHLVNLSPETSATAKGETLLDTALALQAMRADLLVVRHEQSGTPALLAEHVEASVLNAGDGWHEHPTQALLDGLTLRRHFKQIRGLSVAICGDLAHSRVARSNLILLSLLGADVRVIAPPWLALPMAERLGAKVFHHLVDGLAGVDVIMMLRVQQERIAGMSFPSVREYQKFYGLDHARLARYAPASMVMHPGPVCRGVEISSELADDRKRSLIRNQVGMGIAVRQACIEACVLA